MPVGHLILRHGHFLPQLFPIRSLIITSSPCHSTFNILATARVNKILMSIQLINLSTLEYGGKSLPRNVGIHLPTNAASYTKIIFNYTSKKVPALARLDWRVDRSKEISSSTCRLFENDDFTLYRNIGTTLPVDVTLYPRRKKFPKSQRFDNAFTQVDAKLYSPTKKTESVSVLETSG
jgi:hypothetical protein